MAGKERVAVVTGGAQGIGRQTSELLAGRGYQIAIIDLVQPQATIAPIEAAGGQAFGFAGDITAEDTVDRKSVV